MGARICIVSLSDLARDGRVLRQIDAAAAAGYDVAVVGWGAPGDVPLPAGVAFHPVAPVRLPRRARVAQAARLLAGRASSRWFERWYWRKPDHGAARDAVIAARPDLVHANEAISLPLALAAAEALRRPAVDRSPAPAATARTTAGGDAPVPVLFDAHEYSPDRLARRSLTRFLARPFYTWLIRTQAPRAAAMTTVADGIADRYRAAFGLDPVVIRNCPAYRALPPRSTDPTRITLVHHGVALRARRLEAMIDVVAGCDDRYRLAFMLVESDPGYVDALAQRAARVAPGRVAFHAPVAPAEIAPKLHGLGDIGLFLLPPVDFSYRMALPNKLFEFIMAGLAVAIGPSPEMAQVVDAHGCGVVAPDFAPASLAALLNALSSDDIDAMKGRSLAAARVLNAEVEMGRLMALYGSVLEAARR